MDTDAAPRERDPTAPHRRLAWGLAAVVLAEGVASGILGYLNRASAGAAPAGSWSNSGPLSVLVSASLLGFPLVGLLIALRRPGNSIGWIMLGVGVALALPLSGYATYALRTHPGRPGGTLAAALDGPAWVPLIGLSGIFLVLLFPDGHLPSPRWRWFARTAGAGMALSMIAIFVAAGKFESFPEVTNPFGVPGLDALQLAILTIPLGIVGAAVSLVQRYRRSHGPERLQLKWLAAAVSVMAGVYLIVEPLSAVVGTSTGPDPAWLQALQELALLTFGLIPVAIGFAVLKYRLYDIDVVIGKTIVFGALAAFIGAVYVTVVVLLGAAIGATTTNPALSIAATAIVALLFEPVRVRVQRVANRFVYGERATPYEVLSRFSDRIAGTYATEDILPRTARVIAEGTGADRVGVWLRVGDMLHERGAWPADHATAPVAMAGERLPEFPAEAVTVPVRHRDELLGAVTVSRTRGEALTPAEAALLDDLAGQAGLVLANVGLTADLEARLDEISVRSAELRASRQRIVTTQDAERRRLERNIHDGAQQHLVALAVKLRLVRGMIAKDPPRAAVMLAELRGEVDEAIETLSSLALGIYPPVLEERGIGAALIAQAHLGTVPVLVHDDGVDRQPIETEAAVYFCCLEAIQNAAKHANASRVDITLTAASGHLMFEVRDDGDGFDPSLGAGGSGLQGMVDRLSALGGTVRIDSALRQGTVVTGRVPAVVFA